MFPFVMHEEDRAVGKEFSDVHFFLRSPLFNFAFNKLLYSMLNPGIIQHPVEGEEE